MEFNKSGSELEGDVNDSINEDPMNDSEEIIFVGAVTDREWELYTARKLFQQKLDLTSRDRLSLYHPSNRPPCTETSDTSETASVVVDEMRDDNDAAGGTLAPPSTPETVVESHTRWCTEPRVRQLAGRTLLTTFQEDSGTDRDEIQNCLELPRFPDLLMKFESYISNPKSVASDEVIVENTSTPMSSKKTERVLVHNTALGSPYLTRSAARATRLFSLTKELVETPKPVELESASSATNEEASFIVETPEDCRVGLSPSVPETNKERSFVSTESSCTLPELINATRESLGSIDETTVKDNQIRISITPGSASEQSVAEVLVPSPEKMEMPGRTSEVSVSELLVSSPEKVETPGSASEENVSYELVPSPEKVKTYCSTSKESVSKLSVSGRRKVETPGSTSKDSVSELYISNQRDSTTSRPYSVAHSLIFEESPSPLASVSYVNVRPRISKYSQVIGYNDEVEPQPMANRFEPESLPDINTGCHEDMSTASCIESPAADDQHTSILSFMNDYLRGGAKKDVTKDTMLKIDESLGNDSSTTVPLPNDITITVKDTKTEKSTYQILAPKTPDSRSSEENVLELCASFEYQDDLETADGNAISNKSPTTDDQHTSILTFMNDYLDGGAKKVVTKDTILEINESFGNDSLFKADDVDSNKENIAVEDNIEGQGKDMLLLTLQRRFDKHRISTMSDLSLNDTYTLRDVEDVSKGNDNSFMSEMSSFLADEAACRSLLVENTSVNSVGDNVLPSARDTLTCSFTDGRASSSRLDEEDTNVTMDDSISINVSGVTKFKQTVTPGNVSSVSADEDGGFLNTLTDLALLHATMHDNNKVDPRESQSFHDVENEADSSSIQFNDTVEEMELMEMFGMEYVASGKDEDFTQRKKDLSIRNESAFSVDQSFLYSTNKTYNKCTENLSSMSSETEVKRNIFKHSAADLPLKQRFFENTCSGELIDTTSKPPCADVTEDDASLKLKAEQSSTSGSCKSVLGLNLPLTETKDMSGHVCPPRFFSDNSLNEPAVPLCSTTKASKEFYFPKPMSTVKAAKPKYVHEVTPLKVPEHMLKSKSANGRFFNHVVKTPESSKVVARSPVSKSPLLKTASKGNIQSPIGAYINHTPSPSLVANVKPPQVGVYRSKYGQNKKLFPEVIQLKDAANPRGLENVAPNKLCSPLPQVIYKSTSSLKLDEPSPSHLPQLDEKMKRLVGSPRMIVNKHTGRVKASQLPADSPINHRSQLPAVAVDDSCFVDDVTQHEAEVSVVVCKNAYRTNTLPF